MPQCEAMTLTPDKMKEILAKLDDVCREAQELQARIRRAMAARAREDMPGRQGGPEGRLGSRTQARKGRGKPTPP